MTAVDRRAAESGLDSFGLMLSAGYAVCATALRHYPGAQRFVVLCGPGNNGGDGYIAAASLAASGANVAVYSLGDRGGLKGDAARAAGACPMASAPLGDYRPDPGDVVIDALFGAGLSRPVPDAVRSAMKAVTALGLPVIAVDLPSGLDGTSGEVLGESFSASHTVTFMTRKPGHLLMPGRALCGTIGVVDVGIPARIIHAEQTSIFENDPALWNAARRALDPSVHKYKRGHLAVFSGNALATGAARLSATAGLNSGAGLVTIAAPASAASANAAHLTAVMIRVLDSAADLETWLEDTRINAFVLGPGFGDLEKARHFALMLRDRKLVLDADGITAFKDDAEHLFEAFAGESRLVLTPHEGEFARLFPDIAKNRTLSKLDKAVAAARRSNGIIVYKGADTVIAAGDGRAAINSSAPPWLATAGSGDVLAGIIGAHLAQGMPAFEAAAAGVWRHGRAADIAGDGMNAEDLACSIEPLPVL